jgi:hypothetical protein
MPALSAVSGRLLVRLVDRNESVILPSASAATALAAVARRRYLKTTRCTLPDGRVRLFPAGRL